VLQSGTYQEANRGAEHTSGARRLQVAVVVEAQTVFECVHQAGSGTRPLQKAYVPHREQKAYVPHREQKACVPHREHTARR